MLAHLQERGSTSPIAVRAVLHRSSLRCARVRAVSVLLLMLTLPSLATATPEPGSNSFSASQSALYKKLTHELIAPCCWREPIAIHRSEESLQMLSEVKQFVEAGRSEEEIKAFYVSRYGVRILADPPGSERSWLYCMPPVLFLTGAVLLSFWLSAAVRPPGTSQVASRSELISRIRNEIESEGTE